MSGTAVPIPTYLVPDTIVSAGTEDSVGWQTLPAMDINAVPYAMYADNSQLLNGKSDVDFLQLTNLPSCQPSEALNYNGSSFGCVAASGGGGGGGNFTTSGTSVSLVSERLGIGTTNPQVAFEVVGQVSIGGTNNIEAGYNNANAFGQSNTYISGGSGSNNTLLLGNSNSVLNGGGGSNSAYLFGYNNSVDNGGNGGNEIIILGSGNIARYSSMIIGRGVSNAPYNAVTLGNGNATINILPDGKVGVSTTAPVATLDINGFAKLKINTTEPVVCDFSTVGSIALDANTNLCVCKATGWFQVNSANSCQWMSNCPSSASGQPAGSYSCQCGVVNVPTTTGWGSNPYTYDSNLCAMAVHAGTISASGGVINYTVLAVNPTSFTATTANQVTTNSWSTNFPGISIP